MMTMVITDDDDDDKLLSMYFCIKYVRKIRTQNNETRDKKTNQDEKNESNKIE